MPGWYRKLTSSCVSFKIYQQCNGDIEGHSNIVTMSESPLGFFYVLRSDSSSYNIGPKIQPKFPEG